MRSHEEIISEIKMVIADRIQPVVERDGGEIVFEDFENGVVRVSMNGACQGCPSSTATLKMGIENTLCHFVPEVREVIATNLDFSFPPPFMFFDDDEFSTRMPPGFEPGES
jgi:Fe-S cluster biogenesis protein NfuA